MIKTQGFVAQNPGKTSELVGVDDIGLFFELTVGRLVNNAMFGIDSVLLDDGVAAVGGRDVAGGFG